MNQVLLYSIKPQHILNILNGLKTIEVRKRDLPQWAKDKLAKGEKVVGYGYCTKAEPILCHFNNSYYDTLKDDNTFRVVEKVVKLNGLVVVKFEVSGSEFIDMQKRKRRDVDTTTKLADGTIHRLVIDFVLEYKYDNPEGACLTDDELHLYGNGAVLYAHHLTNITPIEPMELWEFYSDYDTLDTDSYGRHIGWYDIGINPLTKAPQSFQSVWVKGE